MNPTQRHALAGLLLAAHTLAGCQRSEPELVSAEFLDDASPDGEPRQDETLRLTLSQPLPESVTADRIRVLTSPQAEWTPRVERTPDPRILLVRIVTGTPAFKVQGIHGRDPDATGIGIDWGSGPRWADLQPRLALPALVRAVWEDVSHGSPNMALDEGDRIRLVFDAPVQLRARDAASARARVPQDFILGKPGDRLDDSNTYATLEPGDQPNAVLLVLGSHPHLTVPGTPRDARLAVERSRASAPSTIAVHGTSLIPMPKIVDARGGPGVVSAGEVDLEPSEGFPSSRPRPEAGFPAPGCRLRHTVTPLAEGRALVAGGATHPQQVPLDQVLVFDPAHVDGRAGQAFVPAQGKLPHPADHATATLLAGPDGHFHTLDDAVLIAGGFDGERTLTDLTLVEQQIDGTVTVTPLEARLSVRRAEHAAVAVGPNRVLIDGGRRTAGKGRTGVVECAELITLSFEGGRARVAEHIVFRTLARARHTLTLLAPSASGETFALAYGGLGRDHGPGRRDEAQRRNAPALPVGAAIAAVTDDLVFATESAAVLSCPYLIGVDDPPRVVPLDCDFQLAHARWGHAALPFEAGSPNGQTPRPELVVIAGGTVHHPVHGVNGPLRLWELSFNTRSAPRGNEAAAVLLFHFDTEAPARSRIEILPTTIPDPAQAPERLGAALVNVPGLGILITGGETRDGTWQHDTVELFLDSALRVAEVPLRLGAPRAWHQAHLVRRADGTSVFLLGGGASGATGGAPAGVEEIPLVLPR